MHLTPFRLVEKQSATLFYFICFESVTIYIMVTVLFRTQPGGPDIRQNLSKPSISVRLSLERYPVADSLQINSVH